jgi:hypothetical protein
MRRFAAGAGGCPEPPKMRPLDFRPLPKGALLGFAPIEIIVLHRAATLAGLTETEPGLSRAEWLRDAR